MDGFQVKEVMEQVNISPQMQEEIIVNVQNRTEHGNKKERARNLKKLAAAAAVLALMAGAASSPARAFVASVVKERMAEVLREELRDINSMVQSQPVAADGFSREYTAGEKERNKELWQAYKNGTFPESVIAQADDPEDAPEGTLCYIRSTGVFNLPAQEMTDEEMLQIIDFQHKMSYAVAQSGVVTEEEKAAYRAEEERKRTIVREAGGISEEEAIEIAEKQLAADLGESAASLELMTDAKGRGAILADMSDESEIGIKVESKAGVAYDVSFGDPDTHAVYGYIIDAVDGSILYTY